MDSIDSSAEVEGTEQPKKRYETPNLVEHGTLEKITKGSGSHGNDAGTGKKH